MKVNETKKDNQKTFRKYSKKLPGKGAPGKSLNVADAALWSFGSGFWPLSEDLKNELEAGSKRLVTACIKLSGIRK